jgi:hypothetical protein
MTIRKAIEKLTTEISDKPWFVGIGDGGDKIIVYVSNKKDVVLKKLTSDGYEGHQVSVENIGTVKAF